MKSNSEMSIGPKSATNRSGISKSKSKEKDVAHEEMHALLAKLKELVPNMPKNRKLSKLEIIQYVIDYIVDLQIALETHPSSRPVASANPAATRQPLCAISPSGNSIVNACGAQDVTPVDKLPQTFPEVTSSSSTRPVSC